MVRANKVKKRMFDYGLRQVEVATGCGVSSSTVYDVVMGHKKSRKVMEFIAERTKTTLERRPISCALVWTCTARTRPRPHGDSKVTGSTS